MSLYNTLNQLRVGVYRAFDVRMRPQYGDMCAYIQVMFCRVEIGRYRIYEDKVLFVEDDFIFNIPFDPAKLIDLLRMLADDMPEKYPTVRARIENCKINSAALTKQFCAKYSSLVLDMFPPRIIMYYGKLRMFTPSFMMRSGAENIISEVVNRLPLPIADEIILCYDQYTNTCMIDIEGQLAPDAPKYFITSNEWTHQSGICPDDLMRQCAEIEAQANSPATEHLPAAPICAYMSSYCFDREAYMSSYCFDREAYMAAVAHLEAYL